MIDKLIRKILDKKSCVLVGLDTRLEYVPACIIDKYSNGNITFEGASKAILEFNKSIIDRVYEYVPAVKVQIAYYEMYGPEGIEAFRNTCQYAKNKGLIVIGDVKRNDIGSTAEAYADAYLGRTGLINTKEAAFDLDFITVNPYLGIDGIAPFIDACIKYDKGIFILVKTSNSSSAQLQDLQVKDKKLYEIVAQYVDKWGKKLKGQNGYSSIGAVVGATHPEDARHLRNIIPNAYFLVPGYGAQGGTARHITGCFNPDGLGAIVNASRSIICAYKNPLWKDRFSSSEFDKAALAEVIKMRNDINKAILKSKEMDLCPEI